MNLTDYVTNREKLRYVNLENNQVLFNEKDLCREIGVVISGSIIIVSYDLNGREIIFNHLDKDEVFGNNLVFSSEPYYKGNVIAQGPTRVCLIDRMTLTELLQTSTSFLENYLRIQSDIGKQLNSRIRLLSLAGIQERFLYYLSENGNSINFTSVTQLAKQLSVSREALSRLIHDLSRRNVIILNDNSITLTDR